jgi:hypothetical protein
MSEEELIERYGAVSISVATFGYLLQSLGWALERLADAPAWLTDGDHDQAMTRISYGNLREAKALLASARQPPSTERTEHV